MKTKQEQIEEMCEAIASMICQIYNPQCDEYEPHTCSHCYANDTLIGDFAEMLYNAGYRKTFTSDTQKAFKEGYEKGCETCAQAWDNGYNDGYESGKEDGVREFAEELKAKTMCITEYEDGTRILQTSNKLIDQSVNIFLTNC